MSPMHVPCAQGKTFLLIQNQKSDSADRKSRGLCWATPLRVFSIQRGKGFSDLQSQESDNKDENPLKGFSAQPTARSSYPKKIRFLIVKNNNPTVRIEIPPGGFQPRLFRVFPIRKISLSSSEPQIRHEKGALVEGCFCTPPLEQAVARRGGRISTPIWGSKGFFS